MRTLTIADNWKDWKFGDTDAVMTFTALDDDKVPDFSNRTLTFKIASTLNNDLEHPKDFAATATGYIQGKDVILKTEDVKQLTPGNYIVELWAMSNDTQKDAVYPSKGFAQFTIEENSMKVSDVTNIPSMTINAFWNAVMQKVGTLTKGAKGDPGQTPKIVMGSVTKLLPDAQPSATLVPLQSDPNTYTLNLQLPQGVQGERGLQGIPGVGSKGLDGTNGLTPTIDPKTKHWMIGGADTGVIAEGQAGKDADPSKYVTIASFNQLQQKDAQQDAVLAQKAGKFELEDKLSQMDLQPEGFENEAALKAEYPNGKAGIMVTVDTGHKWIWINGAWKDCGIYQAKDLSDDDRNKLETSYHHAIAAGNPTNLIYNANLLTKDMTGWTCKDYPEAASFDDANRYQGIASIKITQSGLTESKYTFVESDQFKVVSGQPYYFKVTAKGINTDSSVNSYSAQVFFEDSQGKILDGTGTTNQGFQADWNILSCSGMVPATAETAFVRLILRQNGTAFFSHPVFALRKTAPLTTDDLLPIIETKKSEAINDAHKFVTNNQLDIPQDDFPSSWIVMDSRVSVQNSIVKIENPNGTDSDYVSCFSNPVALSNDRIFIGYSVKTNGCDGINSYPFIQLYFYKTKEDAIANVNSLSRQDWHWITTTPGLYQQNPVVSENKWTDINGGSFAVPKEATYVRIQYILKGKGTAYFTNLKEFNKGASDEKTGLPVLYINGNLSTVTKDTIAKAAFSYKNGEVEKDGYLTIKWQGASSLNYPKKNWNIKLFSDDNFSEKMKVRMKADWANNNSYMLKADWIDATHARNLVNADLWKQLTLSRAVLRNNPVNYVQHSDMPYIDQMSGLDVKHTIYYLDKGFYGKTATVSFDLTTDSAGGDFHLVMSHQTNDLVTGNIQSGTHHYSQTITFDEDKHPDEVSRLSMIVNNHAGNFKLENMALVLGDKEIPDADNPVDSVTKLRKAPNAGTIQGFPILLVINGTPQGLYNFDSKKNNDLWNVDDKDSKNYVVVSDAPDGTLATDNPEFGEGKYNFEVPDEPTDTMKNQFTALARFINSSSDEEFKAQAADKVDLMAAVDQYLFNSYTTMIDAGAKSDVYITYNNGQYWIPSFYDFDSTWGLKADGSAIDDRYIMTWGASPTSSFMMSKLQIRVRDNFPDLVKARWNELKDTLFSPAHITAMFENYISQIDQHYYELDQEIWPNIPSLKTTNRRQLQQFIADRWNVMNEFYANA